jgi:YggT family protein
MLQALQVVSSLLFVYSLLIAIRIILSWFRGGAYGRAWDLLVRATEPYLRIFRRIRFLRMGTFDFSPIAAVLVLVILQNILTTLAYSGAISLGMVLAIILQSVWRAAVWLLFFYLILSVVRVIGLYVSRDQTHPGWSTLDTIVRPLAMRVNDLFGGRLDYVYSLVAAAGVIILVWLVGRVVIGLLVMQLFRLPF